MGGAKRQESLTCYVVKGETDQFFTVDLKSSHQDLLSAMNHALQLSKGLPGQSFVVIRVDLQEVASVRSPTERPET